MVGHVANNNINDLVNLTFNRNSASRASRASAADESVTTPDATRTFAQPDDSLDSLLANLNSGDTGSGLNDLFKSLGLDQLDLSPSAATSLQYAKTQFEINYQTLRAVNTANGIQTQQVSFSLKGSFEFLSASSGQTAPTSGTDSADPMQQMLDYFSPEKTAGRILDFALSFFDKSQAYKDGGNTQEARQNFSDFIGGAIQKGFDQAGAILGGGLPDEIQSGIDQTHDIVFKGLDDFVKNGLDQSKEDDGVYARSAAYRLEVSYSYTSVSAYRSNATGYDSTGRASSAADSSSQVDTAV